MSHLNGFRISTPDHAQESGFKLVMNPESICSWTAVVIVDSSGQESYRRRLPSAGSPSPATCMTPRFVLRQIDEMRVTDPSGFITKPVNNVDAAVTCKHGVSGSGKAGSSTGGHPPCRAKLGPHVPGAGHRRPARRQLPDRPAVWPARRLAVEDPAQRSGDECDRRTNLGGLAPRGNTDNGATATSDLAILGR